MVLEKVKAIKKLISSHYEIDIESKTKAYNYVKARAMAYTLMREKCLMSYTSIGMAFKKNHATILHAVKEFPFMRKWDKELDRDYKDILVLWEGESGEYEDIKPLQLKKQLKYLDEQNKLLNLSLNNVQEELEEIKRIIKNGK
jgi:hypothetical protein